MKKLLSRLLLSAIAVIGLAAAGCSMPGQVDNCAMKVADALVYHETVDAQASLKASQKAGTLVQVKHQSYPTGAFACYASYNQALLRENGVTDDKAMAQSAAIWPRFTSYSVIASAMYEVRDEKDHKYRAPVYLIRLDGSRPTSLGGKVVMVPVTMTIEIALDSHGKVAVFLPA